MERARRRELKHAGVLAARQARVDLAASIARLESDEAAGAGGKALAQRLAFAVGALYGAEVGEPEGVRDRLREASGVLSGVLAHLSAPGTPRALDDAGAAIAKCLAVLYPARAGLERELDSASSSSSSPVVELPARAGRSSLTSLDEDAHDPRDASDSGRPRSNTARGVAPSASGQGMAKDPAAAPSVAPPTDVQPSALLDGRRTPAGVLAERARTGAPAPGTDGSDRPASRGIPPTREHLLEPIPLRVSSPTLIQGGSGDAASGDAETLLAVARPELTRPSAEPVARSSERPSAPSPPPASAPPRARRKALELVPDADEGLVERASGSPMNDASNRRTSDRVTLTADIGMHSATQFFTGLGGDVSHGGLFVATWSPLPLGTEVTVSFVLPGGHQVTAPGCVAWLKEPRDLDSEDTPGMGVRFTALTGEDRRAIDRFLEKRPAIFHDV